MHSTTKGPLRLQTRNITVSKRMDLSTYHSLIIYICLRPMLLQINSLLMKNLLNREDSQA